MSGVTRLKVVGTDLSHHNPKPNFVMARAAGLEWAILKATEGSTLTDKTYAERRQAAYDAGLMLGTYHFARPDADGRDAKLEALHFYKVASPRVGDIVPALDFEVSFAGAEKWSKEFQNELQRLLRINGMKVPAGRGIHYGPGVSWEGYPHLRWVPRYNSTNTPPTTPYDWFQFSNGSAGVPNHFPGLGNVDLNAYGPGFNSAAMKQYLLHPLKTEVKRDHVEIHTMHCSMQYSDTPRQKRDDVEKIFARAVKKKTGWITGTEAGEPELWDIIREVATREGYKLHRKASNWIAVDQRIIKRGSWEADSVFVMDNDKVAGPGHDSVFPWVAFEHKNARIGKIYVAACHYPTHGKLPGDPNFWVNVLYAKALGKWAREKGMGKALVFVGGDFNMSDAAKIDIFFDQPLTTYGDELGKWPNTGHGPIDAMATYDKDTRVWVIGYNALDDRRFFLNSDHFTIEGRVGIYLMDEAVAS